MSRLTDSRIFREWWLAVAALVAVFTVGAGVYAWWIWTWTSWSTTDRLTAIADGLALAGLVDASTAALFTVAALYITTHPPDLWLSASLAPNLPAVELPWKKKAPAAYTASVTFELERRSGNQDLSVYFVFENKNPYSARNPALRVQIDRAGFNPGQGWYGEPDGNSRLWEGTSIHGCWKKPLPALNLVAIGPIEAVPYILQCQVVAEGFRRDFLLRIQFMAPRST